MSSFLPFVTFAQEDEPVIPSEKVLPGTVPYHNMLEIRDFALRASNYDSSFMDIAMCIQTQLEEGDIHIHSYKDLFGVHNAEGRTYRWTRQSFREDRLLPNRRLDLFVDSTKDFAAGVRLMILIVHEFQHYSDYTSNPVGRSPENPAYHNGYQKMMDLFWNFLLPEALVQENQNPAQGDLWRNRLAIFAQEFSRELNGYLQDEYGILPSFKAPEAYKDCVRDLSRQDVAMQFRDFSLLLTNNNSIAAALEKLEKKMRYSYPPTAINAKCMTTISDSGRLDLTMPVGHGGPRQPHVIYSADIRDKQSIVVERLGSNSDFYVDVGEIRIVGGRKVFTKTSTLQPWEQRRSVYFAKGGKKYMIVTSKQEVSAPVSFSVKFKGSQVTENGQPVEYDLITEVLSIEANSELGYYPIYEVKVPVLFSQRSMGHPGQFQRVENIEAEFLAKDFLRMSLPKFEEEDRFAIIYKVKSSLDGRGLPELEHVATLHAWYERLDYRIEESGRYLITIFRKYENTDNLRFNFTFQISRNGSVPPNQMRAHRLSPQQNQIYGYHPPSHETAVINFRQKMPSGYFGHFQSQAILDLDALPGDRIEFIDIADHINRSVHLARIEDGKFVVDQVIHPWYTESRIDITKNAHYYLIFGSGEFLGEDVSSTLHLRRWRKSQGGPQEAKIRLLTAEEQKSFGFYPFTERRVSAVIDQESPKGFFFPDSHFRLYEVTIPTDKAMMILRSSSPALARRMILYRVEENLFADGEKCLKPLASMQTWHMELLYRFEKPGRYIFVLEADQAHSFGQVDFQLLLSQIGQPALEIKFREMTKTEAADIRYRPL